MKNIFFIFGLLIMIVTLFGLSYSHEVVHQQIFAKYGVKSHIVPLPDSVSLMKTIPDSVCNATNFDCNKMLAEQTNNEGIGYSSMIGVIGIMSLIFLGIIFFG